VAVTRRAIGVVVVRGRSMEPTLHDGDRLLVRWGRRGARPGMVGVVRLPDRPLSIKRLAFHRGDGWWVERDSRLEGVDSWQIGPVPEPDLLGIALLRIAPAPGRIPGPPTRNHP
jgi:signal peptidase I